MKNFILNMLSSNNPISCKRVMGSIGFLTSIVYVGLFDHSLIGYLIGVSAALIGLDSILNTIKK